MDDRPNRFNAVSRPLVSAMYPTSGPVVINDSRNKKLVNEFAVARNSLGTLRFSAFTRITWVNPRQTNNMSPMPMPAQPCSQAIPKWPITGNAPMIVRAITAPCLRSSSKPNLFASATATLWVHQSTPKTASDKPWASQ